METDLLENLDLRAGAAVVIGAIIAIATAWTRIRRGLLSISIRRTDRLYRLVARGKWRDVHGAALQLAAQQAFGVHMDDREIRYALERHDPIGLLKSRVRAAHLVRWDPGLPGYLDDRMVKRIPIMFWRQLYQILLVLSLVFLVAFTLWAAQGSLLLASIALMEALLVVWLLTSSYHEIRAAEKLLNEEYPTARNEIGGLGRAKKRRARLKSAKSA